MSSAPYPPPGGQVVPGLELQPPSGPRRRHALGLPSGSVRAMLALIIVILVCVLMLVSPLHKKPIAIPPYLLYLLFMVIGHFFAIGGHGHSRGEPGPLYLPRGFIRFFILAILVATVSWEFYRNENAFQKQLTDSMDELPKQPFLPIVLLGGFFLGVIVHTLVGRENTPYWFEDFEAWVALVAVLGLAIEAMIYLVINPTLKDDPIDSSGLQMFIAAVVAFYFGARS